MKFLKPTLIVLAFVAITYTVSAHKVSFNHLTNKSVEAHHPNKPISLPVHGDLLFAFAAIASLGGYMALKK